MTVVAVGEDEDEDGYDEDEYATEVDTHLWAGKFCG